MGLEISINRETCMGSGNCVYWAEKVFDLDEEGLAIVVDAEGDGEDRIILAAQGCPTGSITVTKDGQRIA
jgi:ferredoxin